TQLIPALLAYLLIVSFFVMEGRVRKGQAARSLEAGEEDRNSTTFVGAAFGLSIVGLAAAPLLNWLNFGNVVPVWLSWVWLALGAGGLGLRLWAPLVLGRFYTRTLRTDAQQTVVDEGPYRLIRHPGYAGNIIMWIGAALAV